MKRVVIPEGAVIVYPHDLVHLMFGYASEGGLRKEMSRRGIVGVSGWPVEDIHEQFGADESGKCEDGTVLGDRANYDK